MASGSSDKNIKFWDFDLRSVEGGAAAGAGSGTLLVLWFVFCACRRPAAGVGLVDIGLAWSPCEELSAVWCRVRDVVCVGGCASARMSPVWTARMCAAPVSDCERVSCAFPPAGAPKQLTIVHSRSLKMTDEVQCLKYSHHTDANKLLIAASLLDSTIKVRCRGLLPHCGLHSSCP